MKGKLKKKLDMDRMNTFYTLSHNCTCGYCNCLACSCSSDKITSYYTSQQSAYQSARPVQILQQ